MKSLLLLPLTIAGPMELAATGQPAEEESPAASAHRKSLVQESQQEAIRRYPDLARPGTPLHKAFLAEYARRKANDPAFFGPVDWPMRLAREVDQEQNPPTAPDLQDPASPEAARARQSFAEGYKDGVLLGKTDAAENHSRDSDKAKRIGKERSGEYSGDRKAYLNGFQIGYNDGWHSR